MKYLFGFILFISTLPLFFQSCVPSKPIDEVEILPSERLINKLEANRRKIKNFEGIGIIEVESDIYNTSASFRVVMQKPDSIYFSILGPFGIELAEALVTDNEFIFYDAMANTVYTGNVNEDVLQNIFKINLSFTDLLDAFVGSVNLTKNLYKQPTEYIVENDKYILTYNDNENSTVTKYSVDIRELSITDYTLKSNDGSVDIEGNYSKFELIESVAVPFEIDVMNKPQNQRIKISYKDIMANRKGLKVNFVIPDDATIIQW